MLNVITGDLLKSQDKFIAHQCNIITIGSAGIANAIFTHFPYSNVYRTRKMREPDEVGTITICGDGKNFRYIINMFAQVYPGQPKYPDSSKDGYKARERYFQACLDAIAAYNNEVPIESIGFPYGIGCNLAAGNLHNYLNMLQNFANKNKFSVTLYKLT